VPSVSGEALLISALINNHDVGEARSYGVSPTHFIGYRDEYLWLQNYLETYNTSPSWEIFRAEFPLFKKNEHADIRSACDLVFKAYGRNQIQTAMSEAVDLLSMGDVTAADDTLKSVTIRRAIPKPKRLLTDLEFLDHWDSGSSAVEVPYRSLQIHTGGIRPGNVWYVAARPNEGKSAHLVNFATRAVLDGCKVKFYSLEMNENEVRFRFHVALAHHFGYREGLTLNDLRDRRTSAADYKLFLEWLQPKLDNLGGYLDIHTPKDGSVTPSVLAESASDYDLNVVDYVGLMRDDKGSRSVDDWRIAAGISNDLKQISGSCESRFLVASQINREGGHGDKPPKLLNLAGTDAIAQDGDVVVTMRALPHSVGTYFSLEKNRHGLNGIRFYTAFDPNRGNFQEIQPEQAELLMLEAEDLAV
jgi:replicative DNA helicase